MDKNCQANQQRLSELITEVKSLTSKMPNTLQLINYVVQSRINYEDIQKTDEEILKYCKHNNLSHDRVKKLLSDRNNQEELWNTVRILAKEHQSEIMKWFFMGASKRFKLLVGGSILSVAGIIISVVLGMLYLAFKMSNIFSLGN